MLIPLKGIITEKAVFVIIEYFGDNVLLLT